MTPYTIEDFKNRRFDPSNSENFLGVSDSSDPYVNFFNSVSKKLIKYKYLVFVTQLQNWISLKKMLCPLNKNFE